MSVPAGRIGARGRGRCERTTSAQRVIASRRSPHLPPGSTRPSWPVRTAWLPRSPRAAGRVSRDEWITMAGDCQVLINTLTAVQDTALAEAARRESDWCEDGTLGETLHRAGRVVLDAADLAAPVLGASHAQAQRRVELAVRLARRSANPCRPTAAPLPTRTGWVGCTPRWPRVGSTGTARASSPTSSRSPRPRSPQAIVAALDDHLHDDAAHPAPAHPAAGRPHLARPAAPACPAGADLDRAAPLGLGAGRRHLVRHVPQRGCRGRLGRDRPARARPRRRRHLLDHRAGPRQGAHRPRHQQRDDRRPGRAHRAGRQGRRGARRSGSTAADRRDATTEPWQWRSAPVAALGAGAACATARPGNGGTCHGDDLVQVQGARPSEPCSCVGTGSATTSRRSHGQQRQRREKARPPFVPCDPLTGARLDPDDHLATDAYRPGVELAALVRARDGRCRFPGCSVAARFCDLDHVRPWPTGPTAATNLLTLCRRHHRIKQRPGWRVRLAPDGTATWTDPAGRDRTTAPLDALETVVLRSDPVDDVGSDRPARSTAASRRSTTTPSAHRVERSRDPAHDPAGAPLASRGATTRVTAGARRPPTCATGSPGDGLAHRCPTSRPSDVDEAARSRRQPRHGPR